MIKRVIKWMLGLSSTNERLSLHKTFIFNLYAFGIKGVLKTPVFVYTNTKIYRVGKIVLNCEMKRGLLTIGQLTYKSQGITKFYNSGTIEINDYVRIEGCTILENSGTIIFKGFNKVSDGCYIIIRDKLVVGEQTNFGFHSFVMDSDDHYAINVADKTVHRNTKPIILGRYNWIGNSTYIKKGTITPDFLFVASANALLTKDYSNLEPYSVIGGSPAKLLKVGGMRRIYNEEEQEKLVKYFADGTSSVYKYPEDVDIEKICKKNTRIF